MSATVPGRVYGISDLHAAHRANREIIERIRPESDTDWLLVAGDVGELAADVAWVLELFAGRFAKVVWVPGNHELWTPAHDPVQHRGERRYRYLVELCRQLSVVTPEDEFPVWTGAGGPVVVAPLLLLYDYSFRAPGTSSKEESLARARSARVVCRDEYLLHTDPYPDVDSWCRARVEATERRLAGCDPQVPLVLVNHFPLVREPTRILKHPEFAQWCGTRLTADWHRRFHVQTVVYGHLHVPRTTWYDGVRFEEVSVGYPREWRRWPRTAPLLRQILPAGPE